MTKYVLNSGGLRKHPDLERQFCAEIVRELGDAPYVLYAFFASPREDWEQKYPEYTGRFAQAVPDGVVPTFELAMPGTFATQVNRADVIFLPGGDDHLLQYWLRKLNVPEVWKGKVVATSSASSNAVAQSYWTCDWRETHGGLDILPIKFLPHFKSDFGADDPRGPIDWDAALAELEAYGNTTLPVHALREGEFVVVER